MAGNAEVGTGTRKRLLESAGEVFAEKGYRKATIREIVQRAGANLNAVNYHFRDKASLYKAVFEYAHERAVAQETGVWGDAEQLDAEQRLRTFIRLHLQRMLEDGYPAWLHKLRVREMIEPTGILETMVEKFIRPRHEMLVGIISELAGADVAIEKVRLCAMSVVAQCLHYNHGRLIISQLNPKITYDSAGVDAMIEHIMRFSLAAIQHYRSHNRSEKG